MKRMLLIFDQGISLDALKREVRALGEGAITLFPLTSRWSCIRAAEEICASAGGMKVELAESAKLIDGEVDLLRQRISRWSAELSAREIDGRSVKEWFLLPDGEVSTWWFSLLAEKNPVKTDIFYKIAQLNAIDRIVSSGKFDMCVSSLCLKGISGAVEKIAKRHSLKRSRISQTIKKRDFKKRMRAYLAGYSMSAAILNAMVNLRAVISHIVIVKTIMGSIEKRLKRCGRPVLFVSYFPLVDKESAERGELKNRYALALQEKIAQMKMEIVWIWIYVPLDGYSPGEAARLASKFSRNAETCFFIDEFASIGELLRSIGFWLRQIMNFRRLNKRMPDHVLCGDLSVPEGSALIRSMMTESFAGWTGLSGIIYLGFYKNLFSHFRTASHCIYCFEMHGWEKALNAAKNLKAPAVKTVAFQHSFVPMNYFPYFCHPSETAEKRDALSLPLPDILTCNGDIPFRRMSRCGYPNLRKVEAIRYSYLSSYLERPSFSTKEKAILISCPLMRDKTKALISLFHETFPRPTGFKIWLKGHPTLPPEGVLEELEIVPRIAGYTIKYDPISELLKKARIVIAGGSSVVLEALAFGCRVILPVFADCMFFNPLDESDRFYTRVSNPDDLRRTVHKIMADQDDRADKRDIDEFIASYWCLDGSLRRWERVLTE